MNQLLSYEYTKGIKRDTSENNSNINIKSSQRQRDKDMCCGVRSRTDCFVYLAEHDGSNLDARNKELISLS